MKNDFMHSQYVEMMAYSLFLGDGRYEQLSYEDQEY